MALCSSRRSGGVPAGASDVQRGVPSSESADTSFKVGNAPSPVPPPKTTMRRRTGSKMAEASDRAAGGSPSTRSRAQIAGPSNGSAHTSCTGSRPPQAMSRRPGASNTTLWAAREIGRVVSEGDSSTQRAARAEEASPIDSRPIRTKLRRTGVGMGTSSRWGGTSLCQPGARASAEFGRPPRSRRRSRTDECSTRVPEPGESRAPLPLELRLQLSDERVAAAVGDAADAPRELEQEPHPVRGDLEVGSVRRAAQALRNPARRALEGLLPCDQLHAGDHAKRLEHVPAEVAPGRRAPAHVTGDVLGSHDPAGLLGLGLDTPAQAVRAIPRSARAEG